MIQPRGTRWRVVVKAGRDPFTNKRLQFAGTADSEPEAQEMERRFQLRAEADHSGRIPLWILVEEWWGSGPRLAATTVANYRSNLKEHILPVLGDRRAEEIRPRLVAQFLHRLQDEGCTLDRPQDPHDPLGGASTTVVGGLPDGQGHPPCLHVGEREGCGPSVCDRDTVAIEDW
jgi:hypothetical protein